MPCYLVERTFQYESNLPCLEAAGPDRLVFIKNNASAGVAWIYSFVSLNRKKSYCIYEAPTPEALRQAAVRNGLPVDRIIEVSLLESEGDCK